MKRVITDDGSIVKKTVLPNGIRILTENIPSIHSVAIGVWVDVGSRYERPKENGFSHFIEHMLFKGTKKRTPKDLAAALESLGGSLNGFTSREQTCFYARILGDFLPEAVDVLADQTCNSTITAANIEKEKNVVCEEIKEALDNPSDRIHDLFSATYWGEHPLGQPIMGSQSNIMGLKRKDVLGFMDRHYRSGSVVIAATGAVSHNKLVKLVEKHFSFPKGKSVNPKIQTTRNRSVVRIVHNKNKQTHLCLGFPAPEYTSPQKMPTIALASYLGGGMSSILFQKIREDKGLAYSVYSFNDFFHESGVLGVYLGTDKENLKQATELVLNELRRMKKQKLTPTQLHTLKAHIKGHLILSQESPNSRMNRLARQEFMAGKYQSLKEIIKEIDSVTSSQITEMANLIFNEDNYAIAVLGPVDSKVLDGVI